jgi:hypothetical protein
LFCSGLVTWFLSAGYWHNQLIKGIFQCSSQIFNTHPLVDTGWPRFSQLFGTRIADKRNDFSEFRYLGQCTSMILTSALVIDQHGSMHGCESISFVRLLLHVW